MVSDKKLIILFNEARDFLETISGRDVEELLAFTRYSKVTDMQELYWRFARSLCNKQAMPNTIGDVDELEPFLFGFDPMRTANKYGGDWRRLFTAIREGYTPPGPMDISRRNSFWVQYVRGLISGAALLSQWSFEDFEKFVAGFAHHPMALAGLLLVLDRHLHGMSTPLLADFLRESGFTNYAKPDTHVLTIFTECGIIKEWDTFTCFKVLVRIGRLVGEPPAVVDKTLWYIGSGRFVDRDESVTRYREAFIEYVKPILAKV